MSQELYNNNNDNDDDTTTTTTTTKKATSYIAASYVKYLLGVHVWYHLYVINHPMILIRY